MLTRFVTFEEALGSFEFGLMNRQRIKMVRDRLFGSLHESLQFALEEAQDAE